MAISLARMGSIPASNDPDYNPFAEGEARRKAKLDASKAAQDIKKAQLDLAKQAIENQEYERGIGEDTKRRSVMGDFIRNREGAQDIPIGIQAPEFLEPERPTNAPFGPMNAPAPKPNSMERRTILDLAAVNPDFSEKFRSGQIGERQGAEDRTRKQGFEDQAQIQTGATFAETKRKNAAGEAMDAQQQAEIERQNRAKNNLDWFVANTGRQNANTAATTAKNKPVKSTADQNTYANYGRRMTQAEQDLKAIEESGFSPASRKGAFALSLPRMVQPALAQQQAQAERNFVNATLRRESGAVISPSEFANAEEQYFPRLGDKPETLAQKKRNREIAIESFKNLSGPAWEQAGGTPSGLSAEEEAELEALQQAAGQ